MRANGGDFTAYRHPVLAVACPTCSKGVGVWCGRPSGHGAADLHSERRELADRVFIDQHGAAASIENAVHLPPRHGATVGAGGFWIDPTGHVTMKGRN